MRIATLKLAGGEQTAIRTEAGWVPIASVNRIAGRSWSTRLFDLLRNGEFAELAAWYRSAAFLALQDADAIPFDQAPFAAPYRHPRKIWGIGANYREKAEEMAVVPAGGDPICFMKPDTSLIGPGEAIRLPVNAGRITAEAEIAVIIGRTCKGAAESEAMDFVAGFAPALDMTACDIHARNPRFLGRSKSFDTFFAFGPEVATPDEFPRPERWTVETALNGRTIHASAADRMIYPIPFLVSFLSSFMTLLPGDVILTGTPGSVPLQGGDTAECRIFGLPPLANPVIQEA